MKIKNQRFLTSIFYVLLMVFVSSELYSEGLDSEQNVSKKLTKNCKNALIWYDEHPEYKGEYKRVLKYCETYAKDVSPRGLTTNPILSDFGSMNGVNTRPRDHIHQGIDIIGDKSQEIIAIADGKVLEHTIEDCWGSTLIVDHGKAFDGKNMITIYGHVGEFMVNEGDIVKRGDLIAKLPERVEYRCMARVRHLHLQIGQRYCKKEEKDNWGCKYFIKDFYRSLNPHNYWANGPNKISCFEKKKEYKKGTITYPFPCIKS